MTLGQRLRRRRKALKLTQEELGKACGLTSQYISIIEEDKRSPALPALISIADELGVSIDYLATGREENALDLIPAIKADKTLDLEVRKSMITLVRALRKKAEASQ